MHFRFLQFPRGSQDWSLSDSELERSIPDLALVIQPIPLSEARNGNAYCGKSRGWGWGWSWASGTTGLL